MTATAPPNRTVDRAGIDAPPEAGVPARADGPDDTVHVFDVCDIRIAINTQRTRLTLTLDFERPIEVGQADDPLVRPECGHDLEVMRRLLEVMRRLLEVVEYDGLGADVRLDLITEVGLEVRAEVVELHLGIVLGELLGGFELVDRTEREFRDVDEELCDDALQPQVEFDQTFFAVFSQQLIVQFAERSPKLGDISDFHNNLPGWPADHRMTVIAISHRFFIRNL